jgi:hypothetical protein
MDGRSDLDLFAVTSRELHTRDVSRLRRMHAMLVEAHPEWRERIEVMYVPESMLEGMRTREVPIIRISPGEPLHAVAAGQEYLVNLYLAREANATLYGRPVREVLPEVTRADFVQCVRCHVRRWHDWITDMRHAGGQAYAVLTLCRALYAIETGEQPSKRKAARWARQWLPDNVELIDWAMSCLYEPEPDGEYADRYDDLVDFVRTVNRHLDA